MERSSIPNKLLRKLEKKFSQLSSSEELLLDVRKIELFLQAKNKALEDMIFVLLADKSIKGSLINDWKRLEDVVLFMTK